MVNFLWDSDLLSTFSHQIKLIDTGCFFLDTFREMFIWYHISRQHIAQSSTICKSLKLHNSKEVVHLLQRHVDTYGWTGSYESPEVYGHTAYSQNVGMLRLDALSSAGWMEKIGRWECNRVGMMDGFWTPFCLGGKSRASLLMFLLFNESMLRRFFSFFQI